MNWKKTMESIVYIVAQKDSHLYVGFLLKLNFSNQFKFQDILEKLAIINN